MSNTNSQEEGDLVAAFTPMSILTKEETRAVKDSDQKLFKQRAACFVGSQH